MQMLTKIIYKNFRSNFKNYVAFFIGNMMGVTEFFVFWGLYSIVKNISTNSVMLEDTLEEIIISVSVITIFSTALMVYSMLNYIKKRIADYSLFYILGMKKQKLYVFVFSEYLAGWMVSLLIGLGIGRGILYLIQQIWHKLFPTYISLCSVGTEIYFNTCKISFFIMLAVVFVLLIWADNSGISRMIAGNEIKEKRPKSIYWSICIVIGGGLLILGYWSYPNNTFTGYVLSHVEWIMGGFLILIFGGGILLEIIHSHLKFYLKNLLKLNQLYSKYQTNVLVLLMFLSLHFIALSYCTANVCELLPINGHEKYYPYQAIWMNRGEKGDISFSETLSHSYNGKYENIPMIRVSSYGNELIGISENTYKKLTGKSADLKNEEIIYIVNEYKNHSGANVTRGGFEYGRNCVKADGANMAVMMNIPENYDKVVEEIKAYAKDHSQVNYFDVDNGNLIYEKKELLLERSKTKLLYVASAAGNIIIMLLCGIFVLSIKMECDFPETEWKYRFYIQSGMSSAKVRKGIIKECLLSGGLPVICGTIISILYCSMLLYAKHLQIEWIHKYFKGIILIVGAIWLLFAVFSLIFAYRNIRKIEGDSRDGKK